MVTLVHRPLHRRWRVWLLMLAVGQAVDVLTTKVDIGRGAIEGNSVAAGLMDSGGYLMLIGVKMLLVVAMATAVVLVHRYAEAHPDLRGRFARSVVWRGLQLCVIVLTLTGLHNVLVLAQMQGWAAQTFFSLPLSLI